MGPLADKLAIRGVAAMVLACASSPLVAQSSCSMVEFRGAWAYREMFVLFFDSNSAVINEPAAAILNSIASEYRPLAHCTVTVAAHTDRAGSAEHNLELSRRRARAVVDWLRQHGIRSQFRIEPFGELRPLVETVDGVVEPQNRRAEITIGDQ